MDKRLHEYINNKKYNKKFNILPLVSLEKQYNITKEDINTIKTYLNHIKYRKQSIPKDPNILNRYHNPYELNHKTSDLHYNIPKQYKTRVNLPDTHCPSEDIERLIGSVSTYSKDYIPEFSEKSKIDNDNKMILPSMISNKHNVNMSDYKPIPYIGKGCGNIDVENEIMCGLPTRLYSEKFKSLGYPSHEEHNFYYIDDRLQHPDSVVLPFPRGGDSTRLDKKCTRIKEESRSMM